MLAAILGLLVGLTIHNIFGLPNKTDIRHIIRDEFDVRQKHIEYESLAPSQLGV